MWFSLQRTTCRLTKAATLDRKSGEAEGSALSRTLRPTQADEKSAWEGEGLKRVCENPIYESVPPGTAELQTYPN
jgi:hypothetical protein